MSEEDLIGIGKYCGTVEQLVIISDTILFLEFVSDGSIQGQGFHATYSPLSSKHCCCKLCINFHLITTSSQVGIAPVCKVHATYSHIK